MAGSIRSDCCGVAIDHGEFLTLNNLLVVNRPRQLPNRQVLQNVSTFRSRAKKTNAKFCQTAAPKKHPNSIGHEAGLPCGLVAWDTVRLLEVVLQCIAHTASQPVLE
jgi:hypothetical protein